MRPRFVSLTIALTAALAGSGALRAEGDRHQSVGEFRGAFTLRYFGKLADGRDCPAGPNRLPFALEIKAGGRVEYANVVSLSQKMTPELRTLFEKGSYCSIDFSGKVSVLIHHARQLILQPEKVTGRNPPVRQETAGASDYEGLVRILYLPVMCQIPPCPPGRYRIEDGQGRQIAKVKTIVIETREGEVTEYRGRYPDFEEARGRLSLDEDGITARLRLE